MLAKLIVLAILAQAQAQADGAPRGQLVIVGGGAENPAIRQKLFEMAGGKKAKIVVVPYASNDPKAGELTAERWREYGAENVTILDNSDPEKAAKDLRSADIIWMRGGNQQLLMQGLSKGNLAAVIHQRFREGGIVAGTSAGAAVMSSDMIVGNGGPRGSAEFYKPRLSSGLGLWPEVIVDQHFVKRNRRKRLEAAIESKPDLVGVGIEESTAVIVNGRGFEVIGKGPVLVLDRRKHAVVDDKEKAKGPADDKVSTASSAVAAENPAAYTLTSGMKFDLDKGLVSAPPMPMAGDLTQTQDASPH